jgi:hypothetical protein
MLQFQGILSELYTGAGTSRTSRWAAANYIDRVLFATPSAPCLFWPGSGKARLLPGLPNTSGYDGVEVFAGKVLLWRGSTLKWSATNDFSMWIPVAETPASGRALLEEDVVVPAVGALTEQVYLSGASGEVVPGQYVRVVSNEEDARRVMYDYFLVRTVSSAVSQFSTAIKRPQSVSAGKTTKVFLGRYDTHIDWTLGSRLTVNGESTRLRVVACSRNVVAGYSTSGVSGLIPPVGDRFTLSLSTLPSELKTGDVVSVGPQEGPGQDLYQLAGPPSYVLTLTRLDVGDQITGGTWASGTSVSHQNWVEVVNDGTGSVSVPAEAEISVVNSVVLQNLGYTGGTEPGQPMVKGSIIETVEANDSGELDNVGNLINGPIFGVVTLADYAYILKKKSIQSLQAVDAASGSLFVRTEILDEGPVGRYAWCRFSDRSIAFVGAKGFYIYAGGQDLRQLANSIWDTFFDELDKARADEVIGYHNRQLNEVWFVYPTKAGETKVVIYNYDEKSFVIDRYSGSLNGITAVGAVDWELAPTWDSLDTSEKCNGTAKRWYEYIDLGSREYAIMAIAGDWANPDLGEVAGTTVPRLLLHGRVFSRSSRDDCNPEAYTCIAETLEFDFGDPEAFKYVDTVYLSIWSEDGTPLAGGLQVQLGTRDSLGSPVRWTSAAVVEDRQAMTGYQSGRPVQVNLTGSGRLIRLRFLSSAVGAEWAISGYRIVARLGGTS